MSLIPESTAAAAHQIPAIRIRCEQSLTLHGQVASVLLPFGRLNKARQFVAADAIVLGYEFHWAIALLIQSGHYSSANALMRPLIETTIRAIWVLYDAHYETVVRISKNKDTNTLGKMLSKLEKRKEYPVISQLAISLSGRTKSILNSFTHGGYEQLSRRESGFDPLEVRTQLMAADLFVVICLDMAGLLYERADVKTAVIPELIAAMKELQSVEPSEAKFSNSGMPPLPPWKDLVDP